METIKIRSHFSGWHEVGREQAAQYVRHLMGGITAMPQDRRGAYIEEHYLRGTSVHDLLL